MGERLFTETGQPAYDWWVPFAPIPDGWSVEPFFPGYTFEGGKSVYRGEEVGEGGYVYAEPGMYGNVALLDIASMHPSSIVAENLFGDAYTKRFNDILQARIAIKHKELDKAKMMLDGKLAKYLTDENAVAGLAGALKIAINSVYGLTSAGFENPFRDPRNVDNIVAKRGALFMVNLKHQVQAKGYRVAHIKTDSIKIPDATPEIINFVMDYGKEYGYTFEHEATYERMCLVNDAVYIAKYATAAQSETLYGYSPKECMKHGGKWTATGKQFAVPYVFKKLFTHEEITFDDLGETMSVSSALYLDMNEKLPDVSSEERLWAGVQKRAKELEFWEVTGIPSDSVVFEATDGQTTTLTDVKANQISVEEEHRGLLDKIARGHAYRFIGKVGRFTPIKEGAGGGLLLRETTNSKTGEKGYAAATGTKGYRWLESEMVHELDLEGQIDRGYYDKQVDEAVKSLSEFGDFEWFISDDPYIPVEHPEDRAPWE